METKQLRGLTTPSNANIPIIMGLHDYLLPDQEGLSFLEDAATITPFLIYIHCVY